MSSDSAWLCVVIGKNLCGKGMDVATREVARMTGDAFLDFQMVQDEFDGDSYAFVKCRTGTLDHIERYRRSSNVVAVLESYDNPSYLTDDEVSGFVSREEPGREELRYGDMVMVGGEGVYSKMNGVVTLAGAGEAQVMFRFHTVTRREWIPEDELIVNGNVFSRLKLPVSSDRLVRGEKGKCPVVKEASDVDTSKRDRGPD